MRQLAALIRRFPFLTRLPFRAYRSRQARYTVGVAGVVLDERGRVLVVEHVFHPRHAWGLPGGWIDADEDPAQALKRELREELGLEVDVRGALHVARSFKDHIDIAYLCHSRGPVARLNAELLDYRWAEADSLPDLRVFHRRAVTLALDADRNGD